MWLNIPSLWCFLFPCHEYAVKLRPYSVSDWLSPDTLLWWRKKLCVGKLQQTKRVKCPSSAAHTQLVTVNRHVQTHAAGYWMKPVSMQLFSGLQVSYVSCDPLNRLECYTRGLNGWALGLLQGSHRVGSHGSLERAKPTNNSDQWGVTMADTGSSSSLTWTRVIWTEPCLYKP